MSDTLEFFEGFIANPAAVGSPVPSGPELAAAVAEQISADARCVLELGPGTGAVTQAICRRGVPEDGLVAIECDADFADSLRRKFKTSRIIEGDAFAFRGVLEDEGVPAMFDAIVSGIPVLNKPEHLRLSLLRDAMLCLKPGAPFIQISYAFRSPYPATDGVMTEHAARVWRNLPPLHIWVYRAARS